MTMRTLSVPKNILIKSKQDMTIKSSSSVQKFLAGYGSARPMTS